MEEPQKKKRIGWGIAFLFILVALTIDGIQLLLTALAIGIVLSPLISICAWVGFWICFKMVDVSFVSNPKKLIAGSAGGIIEAIPAISALPGLTAAVLGIILITMAEDRGGIIGQVASPGSQIKV